MAKARIGLIGIVGEEAKQDYWGTMERVAAIGYQGIEGEGALLQGDVAENLKRFQGLGLQVLTVSAGRDDLKKDLSPIIKRAHALESPRVTVWWGPCETRESVLGDAELYNTAGAQFAREGIKLCYHHHDHEYRTSFNGVCAMDILADNTDPAALSFVIDIAWATYGGADPVAVLKRMAPRTPSIHVKDLHGLSERGQWTAVGTGVVAVQESVRTAIECGIEWAVIEQDKLRNLTAFETATVSYLNLKEAGLV